MAKSTFLALCNKLITECGADNTGVATVIGNTGDAAMYIKFVADADLEVQGLWFDWDFLHLGTWSVNTVIGIAAVAAPSDLGVWDSESFYLNATLASNQKLNVLDYKTWRTNYRQGVQTNQKPANIVILPDQSLKLHSPPDAVYALTADYWKRPAKMTVDGSTSVIPEEYERIIIARGKIFYGEKYAAGEVLQAGQIEFDYLLDKLEAKYLPNQQGRRMADPGLMVARPE